MPYSISQLEATPWPLPQSAAPKPHRQRRAQPADPAQGKPHNWPFGQLTEQQIRERTRIEARMRAGRLAALPEALL